MAQLLALLALLRKLIARESRSFSSVGLNNLLFCGVFLLLGARGSEPAFWSTLLFQLVLLAPLLVTFSVDTQHRLPAQRVALLPLTRRSFPTNKDPVLTHQAFRNHPSTRNAAPHRDADLTLPPAA